MKLPLSMLLVLLAYLALGLVYDQSTPIFEASDEVWHYAVVREIADGRGLPVQRTGVRTMYRQEGSQPPLYYALSAGLTFWIDDSDFTQRAIYNPFAQAGVPGTPVNANLVRHSNAEAFPYRGVTLAAHLIRYFSIALGLGTVLLTYTLALTLFPYRRDLALLAAAFTAFNPMFLFVSAAVDNDSLTWFGSSLTILLAAQLTQSPLPESPARDTQAHPGSSVAFGVLLGLLTLTKLSALVLYPIVGLALWWRAYQSKHWRDFFVEIAIVGGCIVVIAGWWLARNQILYGELLGTRTMAAIYGQIRPRPASFVELIGEAQGWWYSLWGVFGAFSVLAGRWVYLVHSALTLLAVAGGARVAWEAHGTQGRGFAALVPRALALGFLCLTIAATTYWTSTQFASQGRLALGAIAPMSVFLAAGLCALRPTRLTPHREASRWNAPRLLTLGLFVIALIVPLRYIAPIYRPTAPLAEAEMPRDLIPVQATFGGEVELIGYTAMNDPIKPGEAIDVTLYWRGLVPMTADHNLALNVLGRDLATVGKLDTWPGGGLLPTGNWAPGAIYRDHYRLPIAASAQAPTLLRLNIAFWDETPTNQLRITDGAGSSIPTLLLTAGRLVPTTAHATSPSVTDGSTFAGGITFTGYDAPDSVRRGESLTLRLYWEPAAEVENDYTVFVHLVDANGATTAQGDAPPLAGDWPTSAWVPGVPAIDSHILTLPADLAAGKYYLDVGLYDPKTGVRLASFKPNGEEWKDWIVRLARVIEVY